MLTSLVDWMLCTQKSCSGLSTNELFEECFYTHCLNEYASCFYTGGATCSDFYFSCAPGCDNGDNECIQACLGQLSPQGFQDAFLWDECRFKLCDLDASGSMDSEACTYLGSYFGCVNTGISCIDPVYATGSGSCLEVSECLADCDTLSDSLCITQCLKMVGPDNAGVISDLYTCAIKTCGTSATQLTPECVDNALKSSCSAEMTACVLQ